MSGILSSRAVRWVVLVLACLSGIALFLLATATAAVAIATVATGLCMCGRRLR